MSPKRRNVILDHLEELRWHLIRSAIAVLSLATGAFIFKDFIFNVLLFGPKDKSFITYRVFCSISQNWGKPVIFAWKSYPFGFRVERFWTVFCPPLDFCFGRFYCSFPLHHL